MNCNNEFLRKRMFKRKKPIEFISNRFQIFLHKLFYVSFTEIMFTGHAFSANSQASKSNNRVILRQRKTFIIC